MITIHTEQLFDKVISFGLTVGNCYESGIDVAPAWTQCIVFVGSL